MLNKAEWLLLVAIGLIGAIAIATILYCLFEVW